MADPLRIETLQAEHVVAGFDCGPEELLVKDIERLAGNWRQHIPDTVGSKPPRQSLVFREAIRTRVLVVSACDER
jgi:hypothetical protein